MEIASGESLVGAPGGSWYTWWRGDVLPVLSAPLGFRAEVVTAPERVAALARLTGLDVDEARERIASGHRAYVALVHEIPAGWGWSAAREARIGELGLVLRMLPGNRYLWSFETVPERRGLGIYPALLRYILWHEVAEAERFWIGHEPGNTASARGILKAGFEHLGDIVILPGGGMRLVAASGNAERVWAGAAILGARVA